MYLGNSLLQINWSKYVGINSIYPIHTKNLNTIDTPCRVIEIQLIHDGKIQIPNTKLKLLNYPCCAVNINRNLSGLSSGGKQGVIFSVFRRKRAGHGKLGKAHHELS
jgi:hypothetical protein